MCVCVCVCVCVQLRLSSIALASRVRYIKVTKSGEDVTLTASLNLHLILLQSLLWSNIPWFASYFIPHTFRTVFPRLAYENTETLCDYSVWRHKVTVWIDVLEIFVLHFLEYTKQ